MSLKKLGSKTVMMLSLLALTFALLVAAPVSKAEASGPLPLPGQVSCFWSVAPLPKKDCTVRDLYSKVFFATAGKDVSALQAAAWTVYGPYQASKEVPVALDIAFSGDLSKAGYGCVRESLLRFILDLNTSRKTVSTMSVLYDAAKKLAKPLGAGVTAAKLIGSMASSLKTMTQAAGKLNESVRASAYAKASAACSTM